MNKIDIFIGSPTQYRLDVGDFDMSYNYSFNDIRDITKRNSSYSKTITIPATKNNNIVLGGLFDINSTYTLFNPNVKIAAKVLVNTQLVMQGFMVLNSVDKLNNVDSQGNKMYYNLTIFSQTVDLLEKIGEKTLAECFELDKYNHIFDEDTIVGSWSNTYQEGFVYPLLYNDDPTSNNSLSALANLYAPSNIYKYEYTNFFPSVFYKAALDAVLTEAGFGWEGSFKDNAQFQNEIIPFTGVEGEVLSEEDIEERRVEVETPTVTIFTNVGECNTIQQGSQFNLNVPLVRLPCTDIIQDNSNQYSINDLEIVSQFDISFQLSVAAKFDLRASTFVTQTTTLGVDRYTFDLVFETFVEKPNGTITSVHTYTVANIQPPTTLFAGQTDFRINNSVLYRTGIIDVEANDKVFVVVKGIYTKGDPYREAVVGGVEEPIQINISFKPLTKIETVIKNLFVGATVNLRRYFDHIKQKDLITDLIKRYNLVITPDPNNPNILLFDTYKDYFENNTEVLNWTDKKDYSQEDVIEFIQELQNNTILFSYTAANESDVFNQSYIDATNDIYGEIEVAVPNANTGMTEIITPFSPTPIITTGFGAFVPAISAVRPTGRQRVLYYGGLKPMLNNGSFEFKGKSYSTYPYAGHFDDPITPSLDLNFGTCKFYFYNELLAPTNNTQYTTYWQGYLNQMNEGKLLTAYFYLTENDIAKIKNTLSYKVWVKDSYYYINKVSDYNPMNNAPTKVELLKVKDLGEYSDVTYDSLIINTNSCPNDLYVKQQTANGVLYAFYQSVSGALITQTCCTELGGNWDASTNTCFVKPNTPIVKRPSEAPITSEVQAVKNGKFDIGLNNQLVGEYEELLIDTDGREYKVVTKNRQFTFGTQNLTNSDNSFIVGKNNNVLRNDVSLINSSDNTVEGVNITALGVTGQTMTESNSLYFGNSIRVNTLTGQYYVNGVEIDVAHKVSRRITVAELEELATNPIRLVPEVGTGKYPIIEDAAVYLGTGTVYDEDHILQVYVDGAEHTYYEIENILANGTPNGIYHLDYHLEKHPDKTPYTHTVLDGGIFIKNSVNVTGGDLEIVVTVHYRIVDINNI